jgi:hypothetical protein
MRATKALSAFLLAAVAFLAVLANGWGQTFTNGSFELVNNHTALSPGPGVLINPGDTWLTGWAVGGPGGDVFVQNGVGDELNAYDGQQFIIFNGANTTPGGSLSQTFTTAVGQPYTVAFAIAQSGSGNVSITATAAAPNNSLLASNYCVAPTTQAWSLFQLSFVATSTNATLTFKDTSADTGAVDIALDAVSVSQSMPASGLANGGFEIINNHAAIPYGTGLPINPGDIWLTGWTVGGPGDDVFVHNGPGGGLNPYDGQQFVNFNSSNTPPGGSLSQTFPTEIGQLCTVAFAVSQSGSGNVSITATAVGPSGSLLASNFCVPPAIQVWSLFQLTFIATSTNATLMFKDTSAQTVAVDIYLDAVSVSQSPPPSFLTNRLVAYYPLNGNADDASGNGHNGTNINAALSMDRFGIPGACYSFNGTNSHIDIGNSIVLGNPHDAMTLTAWFLLGNTFNPNFDADYVIVSDYNGPDGTPLGDYTFWGEINFQDYAGTTNLLFFDRSYPPFGGAAVVSPAAVHDNRWHSTAVVVDGQGTINLYVDGVLSSQGTYDSTLSYTHGQFWRIGADYFNNELWNVLNGSIDDVRFYNVALSSNQVAQLYAYESTTPDLSFLTNGLVAYYPFNGNAHDAIGTNNGVVFGAVLTNDMFGNPNQAYYFGGNSYIQIPSSTNVFGSGDFTISMWFNPLTYPNPQITSEAGCFLISKGQNNFELATGSLTASNGMNFLPRNAAGNNWYTPAGTFETNNWQHVVAVYQPSATNVQVFVNGIALSLSGPITTPIGADIGVPARLGMRADGTLAFTGLLDSVRIYNRGFSPNEVQELYQYELTTPGMPTVANSLVAYYPFKGNANDASGNGNTAVVLGTEWNYGIDGNGDANSLFLNKNNPPNASSNSTLADYVVAPRGANLNFNEDFTLDAWINIPNGLPPYHVHNLISDGSDAYSANFRMVSAADGTNDYLQFVGGLASGDYVDIHAVLAPLRNTWWQAAVVRSGNGFSLFQNGTLVAVTNLSAVASLQNGSNIWLGGMPLSTNETPYFGEYPLDGGIADIRMYDRALSSSEVQGLYATDSATNGLSQTAIAMPDLVNGFFVGTTVTDGGYGYTNTPIVQIIGGGGSGAQAEAVVSNGVVVAIHVVDAGSGYTNAPNVVIAPPFVSVPVLGVEPMSSLTFSNLTIGGIYQLQQSVAYYWTNLPTNFVATNSVFTEMVAGLATSGGYRLALSPVPAQAFATPEVVNGFLVGATVTSGGSGYITNPPVNIVGGGGSNATASSEISGGMVTNIIITDAGIGYTNTPTVEIGQPPAAAVSPAVQFVLRVDSSGLAPYDNYQIQFTPVLSAPWGNLNGGLFVPTDVTNSQYLFVTNASGFFRIEYLP